MSADVSVLECPIYPGIKHQSVSDSVLGASGRSAGTWERQPSTRVEDGGGNGGEGGGVLQKRGNLGE